MNFTCKVWVDDIRSETSFPGCSHTLLQSSGTPGLMEGSSTRRIYRSVFFMISYHIQIRFVVHLAVPSTTPYNVRTTSGVTWNVRRKPELPFPETRCKALYVDQVWVRQHQSLDWRQIASSRYGFGSESLVVISSSHLDDAGAMGDAVQRIPRDG